MLELIARLRENIGRVLYGKPEAVDRAVRCLLARGHLLIEDVPGVGKTVLASALARSIDASFARIQMTPDLLPADVLGTEVLDAATGSFTLKRGPIFANIVLADEVNRTPPRTQAALLEAMAEGSVTIDGRTLSLEPPFMVVATQNPFDFEGTYALPENQLDRFLMRMGIGYPSADEEARVLDQRPGAVPLHTLTPVVTRTQVLDLQQRADAVRVHRSILDYIVAIAATTRKDERLRHGLSPRGALALAQAARATALCQGRDYAVPEDVVDNVLLVGAHRVVTRSHAGDAAEVLRDALESVPSPA